MRPIVLALMLGLAFASPAGAAKTDRAKFEDTVHRVAPLYGTFDTTGKSKALCVCNTNGRAGVLESLSYLDDLYVRCTVPSFNASGSLIGSTSCDDWTSVTK